MFRLRGRPWTNRNGRQGWFDVTSEYLEGYHIPLVHPGSEAAMAADLAHVRRNDLCVDQRVVHGAIGSVEGQSQFDLLALEQRLLGYDSVHARRLHRPDFLAV